MDSVHRKILALGLTDKGPYRERNEDAFLVDNERGLFAVADGIGGRRGGGKAARAVVDNLPLVLDHRLQSKHGRVTNSLRDAIRDLNTVIRSVGQQSIDLLGMGSTLACLFIRGRKAYIANMGDSRVYHWRDGLACLTRDHTLTALLVREREISARSASRHPAHGQLTRYVGMQQDIYPDICTVSVRLGDRFLLCTDGLWNALPDKRIGAVIGTNGNPHSICATLIDEAKVRGSRDNITSVFVSLAKNSAQSRIHVKGVYASNEKME